MSIRFVFFLWSLGAVLSPIPAADADLATVRIGRVSKFIQKEVEKEVGPFLNYLQTRMPSYRFQIVRLSSDQEAMAVAARGSIEFLYVTPSVFVQLEAKLGAVVIATAKRFHGPKIVLKYVGGVVICRSDRHDIQKLADLRGKRIMGLNPMALGGWLATLRELKEEGIDPERDFKELKFATHPYEVLSAVWQGYIDVGVLSISEYPQQMTGGQFTQKQFRTLAPRLNYPETDTLPVPVSTRLYPGTAFLRMPHVADELAEKVATALFDMSETSGVAASMLVAGWTLPANYQPVHECLKALRLAPYQDFGKLTLTEAIGQHWQKVIGFLLVLLGALTVAMVAAMRLNSSLRRSQVELHQELEQRQQAERTLAYQAQLLAQSHDAIIATDPDRCITFWNKAAERLFGWEGNQALGHTSDEMFPSPSGAQLEAEIRRQMREQGSWSGELIFENRSGTMIPAGITISSLRDSDGKVYGTVSVIRDLSERKRLEEQLLQSQKLQAIGLLAGGVAHDFNNLLTVINGYTQMAVDKPELDSGCRAFLQEVLNAGNQASGLTQQLLAFGRKQVLQPQILAINEQVEESARMLQRLIGESIEVTLDLDPDAGCIRVDKGQMQQVIVNLALNARDAMLAGGKLIIQTSGKIHEQEYTQNHIEIPPTHCTIMKVIDTGQGMDSTVLQRIFEPFFTTKEKGRGTGLGLSTVYGIIKQSRGHIWVKSALGSGTTFTICLPKVENVIPITPEQITESSPRGKEMILLVEDQAEVRRLVHDILGGAGYTVLPACDAQEALQKYDGSSLAVDLLVTDVIMPGMTGQELAVVLRKRRPALKVLYMSGYADDGLGTESLKEEGTSFLQKPFTPQQFTMKIREILGPLA